MYRCFISPFFVFLADREVDFFLSSFLLFYFFLLVALPQLPLPFPSGFKEQVIQLILTYPCPKKRKKQKNKRWHQSVLMTDLLCFLTYLYTSQTLMTNNRIKHSSCLQQYLITGSQSGPSIALMWSVEGTLTIKWPTIQSWGKTHILTTADSILRGLELPCQRTDPHHDLNFFPFFLVAFSAVSLPVRVNPISKFWNRIQYT